MKDYWTIQKCKNAIRPNRMNSEKRKKLNTKNPDIPKIDFDDLHVEFLDEDTILEQVYERSLWDKRGRSGEGRNPYADSKSVQKFSCGPEMVNAVFDYVCCKCFDNQLCTCGMVGHFMYVLKQLQFVETGKNPANVPMVNSKMIQRTLRKTGISLKHIKFIDKNLLRPSLNDELNAFRKAFNENVKLKFSCTLDEMGIVLYHWYQFG